MRYLGGVVAILTTIVLFAAFVVAARAGLKTTLSPTDLTALRFMVAGTLLLPVFLRHRTMGIGLANAGALAFFGGLGFAFTAYSAFQLAPASHGSALLHGTLPLTTIILQSCARWAFPPGKGLLPILLICVGIVLLIADSLATSQSQLIGDALLLLASGFWSAYGILAGRLKVSALPAAAMVAVFSCTVCLPLYILFSSTSFFDSQSSDVLMQMVVQGVLIGVIANVTYMTAVSHLGAPTVALALAMVPTVTAIASFYILGEQPTTSAIFGIALVTAGIAVSALLRSQTKSSV